MEIINALKKNIDEENKTVALRDCLHNWDGNVDTDVVVGGIQDRVKAMTGERPEYISIERDGLRMVKVKSSDGSVDLLFTKSGVAGKGEDFFHYEELTKIGKFLIEEFYYK